jgi:hypothetical protein
MGTISIMLPHPLVVMTCIAAFGIGYIIRWALEESGIDLEERIRRLFGR